MSEHSNWEIARSIGELSGQVKQVYDELLHQRQKFDLLPCQRAYYKLWIWLLGLVVAGAVAGGFLLDGVAKSVAKVLGIEG